MRNVWSEIQDSLCSSTGKEFRFDKPISVPGGCINQSWKLSAQDSFGKQYEWFVKTNKASLAEMFHAEYDGLIELAKPEVIRIPEPLFWGRISGMSYLVVEYIALTGSLNRQDFGHQLANMHEYVHTSFGWFRENYIGETRQANQYEQSWVSFWQKERMLPQLEACKNYGLSHRDYENGLRLIEVLPVFYTSYQPKPSLLHGDLWSGNVSADESGNCVIYDPATYYGDKEADLAMTELFGGFGPTFFDSYNEVSPIDDGYSTRKVLYNLYHILNHYQLFGGGYGGQAGSMISRLLAET